MNVVNLWQEFLHIKACMVDRRGAYMVLVKRPQERRPLERPRRRWDNNIKMDLLQVARKGMDWIAVAQDRDRWR
jgi:hypothetical protein